MEIFTMIPTVIYFVCYCKEHDFSYSALSLVWSSLTSVALQWESLFSSSLLWTCRRRRDSTHFPPHRLETRKREKSLQELLAAACSITLLGEWQGEINCFLVSWLSCTWKVVAWAILICSACRYTEICFEFVFMWRIGRLVRDLFWSLELLYSSNTGNLQGSKQN